LKNEKTIHFWQEWSFLADALRYSEIAFLLYINQVTLESVTSCRCLMYTWQNKKASESEDEPDLPESIGSFSVLFPRPGLAPA
jgi:hypothetical protein